MPRPFLFAVIIAAIAGCGASESTPTVSTAPVAVRNVPATAAATEDFRAATQPRAGGVGERVPTEDSEIWSFHAVTEIAGVKNLYRSANTMRDIIKEGKIAADSPAAAATAESRLKRLYDKGIRTIVSFENISSGEDKVAWSKLEKQIAEKVGMTYLNCPLANSGADSFEDLTPDAAIPKLEAAAKLVLDASKNGGVLYHCSAGHDRTGMVTAYIRIKYDHWDVEKAIEEMRFYGHNFVKYSRNGGKTSWHEELLRAIAPKITVAK